MFGKYSKYRVLRLFFDSPKKGFHQREISRLIKLGQPSVKAALESLEKDGLVKKLKEGIYPTYFASLTRAYKLYKKCDMLARLEESGLVEFIADHTTPDSIVLFGSASRGEDTESSDVDIFVQTGEKKLELKKFEHLLGREVSLLFEEDASKLSKELLNNLANGIVLYGYFRALK